MKTTVDIADDLYTRMRRMSRDTGRPMRSLFEEGLRLVLDADEPARWRLPDRSVGAAGGDDPLEGLSWQDLREAIYGQR